MTEAQQRHYQENRDLYRERAKGSRERARARRRDYVREVLLASPCVDCGEADLVVLQFDHVRGNKILEISRMVRDGTKWETFVAEIAKCEVVCANCHARRTARRDGSWWKASVAE